MFPDEDACCAYLVAHRWPEGVHCPRCGNAKVYTLEGQSALAVPRVRPADRLSLLASSPGPSSRTRTSLSATGSASSISCSPAKRALARCKSCATWVSAPTKPLGTCATASAPRLIEDIPQAGRHRRSRRNLRRRQRQEPAFEQARRHERTRLRSLKTPVIGAVERKGNVVARVSRTRIKRHAPRLCPRSGLQQG